MPEPIQPKLSPYNSFYLGLFFMQSRKYSLSYVAVAVFTWPYHVRLATSFPETWIFIFNFMINFLLSHSSNVHKKIE